MNPLFGTAYQGRIALDRALCRALRFGRLVGLAGIEPRPRDYEMGAYHWNGPVKSIWSEIYRNLVRWRRFGSWDFSWESHKESLCRWGSSPTACSTVPASRVNRFRRHDIYSVAGNEYGRMRTEVPRPALHTVVNLSLMASLRERIQEHRDAIDVLVRKHRGLSASIFGSVARGEDTSASDVDFLVEFAPGSSLFDLRHLQLDLEALLGCSVDVVSSGGLKDRDQHIRQEAVAI
jgi:predicted nucleotidyltransferase